MEEKTATVKRKAYVQTKLNFPVKVNDSPSTERKIQKDNSTLFINAKQAIKPKAQIKTQSNRKIPILGEFLKDPKLEKLSNNQVYCHYCDTGTPITLHRINDGYRLWQHLETNMYKDNIINTESNPSKKLRTTFLNFESKRKETLNTGMHLESSGKVCHGFYSKSFAALARYGTSTDKYKILRDDNLFDKNVKAHGYIKSNECEGYTTSKYCSKCGILAQMDAVQKRNRRYQELIAQIDCLFFLKEGQPIPASIISQFGDSWAQYDIKKLHETIITSLKHRPGHTKSTELQQLCTYVEKEVSDHSYYVIVNKYPALGRIIEAVETHGLENWVSQCITFLIDKTLEENRPIFVGMAQAVTKVIDKLQRGVTSMRGIGEYHESFIDFLVVLMSISTLATRWLTANLAGPTIRFLRHKRNESDIYYNIYGINTSSFPDIITMWRKAYDYAGPTICAKDQTKVAELIEVCKQRQKWIGCVPIEDTIIPTTMTIEELHNKISNFKKATYITVYALSACIPGIPPIVIAVNPSDQTEKAEINTHDNNLIMRELNRAGAMTIGLYFDGATLDRNWLGEVYSEDPTFTCELALKKNTSIFSKMKYPIALHLMDNSLPFICGTDIYHCVKKGRNMHNSETRVCPIGYYIMSTEHLWILKENSEIYSGLTSNILNPKDKQADESAERFFSSSVLKGNMAHIDRVGFAWDACIFFAGVQHFLKANQATCNGNKFGISWQSCDDFIYLGLTLILLIQQWPNFYSNYPLCPWMISTAFLEHIFGCARWIIEDFTVLDFLSMNEKILKNIMIEMKGDLIRPDNNDSYNIKLSTVKEKLPKNLTDFPSIFDIDNMIEKTSYAMKIILCSLGIVVNKEIFSELIQQSLHSLKKINNHNIPMENTSETDELEGESEDELDNECDIGKLLTRHQQRILNRSKFPEHLDVPNNDLDEMDNENTQSTLELDFEDNFFEKINKAFGKTHELSPLAIMQAMSYYREKYDYFTQKEKKKVGNKATLNKNNLTVVTELGTMDIMAAVRQNRLSNTEHQARTKGRITRWKTACKKVFDSTKINPQSSKFKRGDFYYYCENSHSIVIAEIIAVFEKHGSSYVRVDLLSGLNEGKIHARLYDLKPDSACEFIPIISKDRTQFTCESNPFRFIAHLGSVLEEYHGTSHWLGKTLKLGDLQYATYFHFVGKSCELEQSIKEAEKIMRMRKNNANSNDE
ncbi:hypothetical protein GLOIN_2v1844828 [Rhizophagus irregularis DAOM 181602=DAOM 197198]|nr:hypothetical protein GLOIN_2v1844828 [Rhizophagus irregularis DAOM 181602=DAOM 197198]